MRKIILSIAVVATLVYSCTKDRGTNDGVLSNDTHSIVTDVNDKIHSDFLKINIADVDKFEKFESLLEKNMNLYKKEGLTSVLKEKFNDDEVSMISFYEENADDPLIYDLLKERFPSAGKESLEKVVEFVQLTKIVQNFYLSRYKLPLGTRCAVGVASMLVASAAFAFVPGLGWGLGVALLGKAGALFTLIDGCLTDAQDLEKFKENEGRMADGGVSDFEDFVNAVKNGDFDLLEKSIVFVKNQ